MCGKDIWDRGRGSRSLAIHHIADASDETVVPTHHECHNKVHIRKGRKMTEETKRKISLSMRGNKNKVGKGHGIGT